MRNELELRAGDFGWIVSADALCPDVTSFSGITGVLRIEARAWTAKSRSFHIRRGAVAAALGSRPHSASGAKA